MRITKLEHVDDRAEGDCCGIPYNTELAGPDGVHIHFWLGDQTPESARLSEALAAAQAHRDVVRASWSPGKPRNYWAHSDIR